VLSVLAGRLEPIFIFFDDDLPTLVIHAFPLLGNTLYTCKVFAMLA